MLFQSCAKINSQSITLRDEEHAQRFILDFTNEDDENITIDIVLAGDPDFPITIGDFGVSHELRIQSYKIRQLKLLIEVCRRSSLFPGISPDSSVLQALRDSLSPNIINPDEVVAEFVQYWDEFVPFSEDQPGVIFKHFDFFAVIREIESNAHRICAQSPLYQDRTLLYQLVDRRLQEAKDLDADDLRRGREMNLSEEDSRDPSRSPRSRR